MKFVQAKNYSKANRGRADVSLVVIHTMEAPERAATAENVAAWFAGPDAPKASAHYNVDADSVVQSVAEVDVAWHAGPANGYSIGVEHAGYAKQTPEEWADDASLAILERSAELVAGICLRYDIPVRRVTADDLRDGVRAGLCGHVDVTNGLTGGKGHWDPGPHFPWSFYLDRVASFVRSLSDRSDRTSPVPDTLPSPSTTAVAIEDPWPVVEVDGERWRVAPAYIWPVGIGQAEEMAAAAGCELPSKALVDAIWRAADLRVDARAMVKDDHDGTPATMASKATYDEMATRLAKIVAGRPYRLLAGYAKDIIRHSGKVGLYGWQRPDGSVLQEFFAGHARSWIDYSQGLRLCKRES